MPSPVERAPANDPFQRTRENPSPPEHYSRSAEKLFAVELAGLLADNPEDVEAANSSTGKVYNAPKLSLPSGNLLQQRSVFGLGFGVFGGDGHGGGDFVVVV